MRRPSFDLFPLLGGERLRDKFWRWAKHKIAHIRCYRVSVGSEVAFYYPDYCGGVLRHKDWWALVAPAQLDDISDRLASDERGYHVCKLPEYNAKCFATRPLDLGYNPLSNDSNVSISCRVCRSYTCCRPKEHGILAGYESTYADSVG